MLFVLTASLFPTQASAQKKLLVPSGKVVKIAFLDHQRLRKEYHAFSTAKQKLVMENKAGLKGQSNITPQKRTQQRQELMKEYEMKIAAAINAVVAEGGFTEVKPLEKNNTSERGIDITGLVLKKLN